MTQMQCQNAIPRRHFASRNPFKPATVCSCPRSGLTPDSKYRNSSSGVFTFRAPVPWRIFTRHAYSIRLPKCRYHILLVSGRGSRGVFFDVTPIHRYHIICNLMHSAAHPYRRADQYRIIKHLLTTQAMLWLMLASGSE